MEIIFEKLNKAATIPIKAHDSDAGFDLCCIEDFTLRPGETKLVKLGFKTSMAENCWVGIYSKSGLALKHNVFVLNAPGVIDSGYTGEWGVIIHKAIEGQAFGIEMGDAIKFTAGSKVAQAIVHVLEPSVFVEGKVGETARGSGGFGSTGS